MHDRRVAEGARFRIEPQAQGVIMKRTMTTAGLSALAMSAMLVTGCNKESNQTAPVSTESGGAASKAATSGENANRNDLALVRVIDAASDAAPLEVIADKNSVVPARGIQGSDALQGASRELRRLRREAGGAGGRDAARGELRIDRERPSLHGRDLPRQERRQRREEGGARRHRGRPPAAVGWQGARARDQCRDGHGRHRSVPAR